MKKTLRILILSLTVVLALSVLVACGSHEHTWSTDWSSDATHHWHAASCEHKVGTRMAVSGLSEHDFSVQKSDPTCTVSGKTTKTCTVCGFKEETTVAATGHTYLKGTTDFTVSSENAVFENRYCDTCGAASSTVIAGSIAVTPDTVQEALDKVGENGAYIYLQAGNYGTLYLRAVKDLDTTTSHSSAWAGGGATILHREIGGITIIAAEGAVVDSIVAVGLSHVPGLETENPLYPTEYIISAVTLKSLELRNITFSGNADVAIDLCGNVAVDDLLIDACTMKDEDKGCRFLCRTWGGEEIADAEGNAVFKGTLEDITITNCEIDGAYQFMDFRGMADLLIEGNSFKNIADRVIVLQNDGTPYKGAITVRNNTADTIGERFLRFAAASEESIAITVTGNTITNYAPANGTDTNPIKITDIHEKSVVNVSANVLPEGCEPTIERVTPPAAEPEGTEPEGTEPEGTEPT